MSRNLAASVHQRLPDHARAEERPFNEALQYFALERFLYRLGRSPQRGQFVLKGALMFTAWQSPFPRPTRDIDLLGRLDNSIEQVVSAIQATCQEPVGEEKSGSCAPTPAPPGGCSTARCCGRGRRWARRGECAR